MTRITKCELPAQAVEQVDRIGSVPQIGSGSCTGLDAGCKSAKSDGEFQESHKCKFEAENRLQAFTTKRSHILTYIIIHSGIFEGPVDTRDRQREKYALMRSDGGIQSNGKINHYAAI